MDWWSLHASHMRHQRLSVLIQFIETTKNSLRCNKVCFLADFLNFFEFFLLFSKGESDVDVILGGGRRFFNKRLDGRDLLEEMKSKGYLIVNIFDFCFKKV